MIDRIGPSNEYCADERRPMRAPVHAPGRCIQIGPSKAKGADRCSVCEEEASVGYDGRTAPVDRLEAEAVLLCCCAGYRKADLEQDTLCKSNWAV